MAEVIAVFGAISSILQVVEFAAKVASRAHELIVAGKDALREDVECARLAREYEWIGEVSSRLGTDRERAIARLGKECQTAAQKLLKELQTLRVTEGATGMKRVREGTRKAARAVSRRKDIEKARKHLQELNGQLSTALLQKLLEKQTEQMLQSAVDSQTSGATRLLRMVNRSQKDDVSKVGLLSDKLTRDVQRTIVMSLKFPGMTSRRESIVHAYPDTFRRVVEDDAIGFRRWLRHEGGIFWIRGKPGSGKSTLMRYLCDDGTTHDLLKDWSAGAQLVFAEYYFWYLGEALQKSIEGLLRSILHQILLERPDLIRTAFPQHCIVPSMGLEDVMSISQVLIYWERHELLDAVHAISKSRSTLEHDKKFCIFIDGLDEYHGNHAELTEILVSLSTHPDVKICVSSRPWNAFDVAFESKVPTIYLENITREDHEKYVYGMLRLTHDQPVGRPRSTTSQLAALADEIVDRAEGVFLWVMLVVRSVLEGLSEGDAIAMLRRRVQHFPTDLDDFFRNILGRVDKVYQHQTSQALKLAFLEFDRHSNSRPASFVDYWLLLQDPDGFSNPDFVYGMTMTPVSGTELQEMIHDTRKFLSAACKDLITLPSIPGTGYSWTEKVSFLHRTVYDFLRADDLQDLLDKNVPPHVRDGSIFASLDLARIKFLPDPLQAEQLIMPMTRNIALALLEMRASSDWQLTDVYVADAVAALTQQITIKAQTMKNASPADFATMFDKTMASMTVLAAFRKQELTQALTDLVDDIPAAYITHLPSMQLSVAMAALGECKLNRFSLWDVDHVFLSVLIRALKLDVNASFHDRENSNQSLWQRFLRKWAQTCPEDQTRMRNVWNAAKVFLDHGANPQLPFCVCTLDPEFVKLPGRCCGLCNDLRRWTDVFGFLKSQVLLEWLSESERLATLLDRR